MPRLSSMSIAALKRELARKEEQTKRLLAGRDKLLRKLAALDKRIASLAGQDFVKAEHGAGVAGARRARKVAKKAKRGRKPTLTDAITRILTESDTPLKVIDIAKALKLQRFSTRSKDLPNLVREALTRVEGVKRVSRGVYTV